MKDKTTQNDAFCPKCGNQHCACNSPKYLRQQLEKVMAQRDRYMREADRLERAVTWVSSNAFLVKDPKVFVEVAEAALADIRESAKNG